MRVVQVLAFGGLVGLAACGGMPGGEQLVSAQYPAATGAVNANAEPEPVGSLPPGAANPPQGPTAVQPNYLSYSWRVPGF